MTFRSRWPEYWRFSFSISPSNEYSGFISFRIDWLDLFTVQGILKSLLQHHNLKAFKPSKQIYSCNLMQKLCYILGGIPGSGHLEKDKIFCP